MIELQLIKNIPVLLEKPFLEAGDRCSIHGKSNKTDIKFL